jgi:isopenicillin N synthase-like dioxygenase
LKADEHLVACFAIALGFPEDHFKIAMDVTKPDCLTQLRLLHYPASENAVGTVSVNLSPAPLKPHLTSWGAYSRY